MTAVYNGGMELLFGIGIGVGLAALAGLRAFLPLALVGIFALLSIFDLPGRAGGGGVAVEAIVFGTVVSLLILLALSVLEISLDKIPSVSRIIAVLGIPLGMVSGALLFAAASGETVRNTTLGAAIPELLAGAVIAGLVAFARLRLTPSPDENSAGTSSGFLSAVVDIVVLVAGLIGLFVPVLPIIPVALLLYFFYRIRRRRGRKYEGLRILGD